MVVNRLVVGLEASSEDGDEKEPSGKFVVWGWGLRLLKRRAVRRKSKFVVWW